MYNELKNFLTLVVYAFNALPNKKIDHKEFRDTYELATMGEKLIKQLELMGQTKLPAFFANAVPIQWDFVEAHPVIFIPEHNCYEVSNDENEFSHWSVYLHSIEGGVQCIADVETQQQANDLYDLICNSRADVKKLAFGFASVLKDWLSNEDLAEVISRNKTEAYKDCCASHDFCDANMAMHAAFIKLFKHEPDLLNKEFEMMLWNTAWGIAKESNFFTS